MKFQCSSASRKFLNYILTLARSAKSASFSALQRAENSSIRLSHARKRRGSRFQCSSASRKFLNATSRVDRVLAAQVSVLFSEPKIPQLCLLRSAGRSLRRCFSALQRAENSSICRALDDAARKLEVSVLFSEPKIPQCSSEAL